MQPHRLGALALTLFLSACVTINIYFPSAQAQEAAEKIVEDILQQSPQQSPQQNPAEDQSSAPHGQPRLGWIEPLLDFLVPTAHAAQPDFSVDTPEIRKLQARLKQHHAELAPFFDKGAVGFTQDGLVAIRDAGAIGLRDRPRVQKLVEEDNKTRNALYRAIAVANKHPEWESDVRQVFARTWIEKAAKGWYYKDKSGAWKQK